MGITIYTIAYNGYGQFLPKWLEQVKKNKPTEIIIVLGQNHGADVSKLKGCKILYSDSNVMGTLRNVAIKEINTEWMLYFSADDNLLPNAAEEIFKRDCDVVALKFNDITKNETTVRESACIDIDNMSKWRTTTIPGYIAVRSKMYYEDIEIPNYPYLFKLACNYMRFEHTDKVCAEYVRREHSHGDEANKTFKYLDYAKQIDEYAKVMYDNRVIKDGYISTIDFGDTMINGKVRKGEFIDEVYRKNKKELTIDRVRYLLSLGYLKEVK